MTDGYVPFISKSVQWMLLLKYIILKWTSSSSLTKSNGHTSYFVTWRSGENHSPYQVAIDNPLFFVSENHQNDKQSHQGTKIGNSPVEQLRLSPGLLLQEEKFQNHPHQ